jgi:tetratricopeptide (TPR) repeat protein
MRILQIFFTCFLCISSLPSIWANSKEQLFYDAVRFEANGNIDRAIENYEKILDQASSANLHGNLANLYYKNSDYGRSILHYRKALLLDGNNREFLSNLSFVCRTANLENTDPPQNNFIDGFSNNFWKGFLVLFLWFGLLLISFLFFQRINNRSIILVCLAWVGGITLIALVVLDATKHENLTESQVIALLGRKQDDDNASATIQLRRFAASSSTANASVRIGESLFVNQSKLEGYQSHQGPKSQNWLLVRTADNLKKGWVREDEVGWILKN